MDSGKTVSFQEAYKDERPRPTSCIMLRTSIWLYAIGFHRKNIIAILTLSKEIEVQSNIQFS